MRHRSSLVLVALALGIALIVVGTTLWRTGRFGKATSAAESPAADPIAPPQGTTRATMSSGASPLSGLESSDPSIVAAQRAAEKREVNKVVAAGRSKLVGAYEAENVDQGWAGAKQQALEALQSNEQIEQLNARPVAFDVACRSSTCRVQADFASRLAADDWLTLYLLNAGTELSNSSFRRTDYPDGTASIELYGQAR